MIIIVCPSRHFPLAMALSVDEWLTIFISLLLVVLGVSREVLLVVGVAKFIATDVPSVVASGSRDGMMVSGGQVEPLP